MKHFLMCEPKFFEVSYVINPWMAGSIGKVNKELAKQQWENLYNILSKLASVSLIEPVEGLPDMVFTANAGLVQKRASPKKQFIASSFRYPERQPEEKYFEEYFSSHGYEVQQLQQGTVFEGAGDALFDTRGTLWVGSGFRSDPRALNEIMTALEIGACALELIDPRWYHLDTAFCPLTEGPLIAYEKAFSEKSVEALKQAFGTNIIRVSEQDAINFACNAVSVDQTIILPKVSAEMKAALVQRDFEVIETDVSEFLKAGGACKCLTLEI
jgi:N-dimethylarginine dimethylaminohydrolase